ncbi:hypothetical protein CVO_09460 [Sulfurimonas sp. CVO]|jgi:hypothetical protein|uniref:Uncharacterized protein n=1 Tax=Sulfurimonas xiamenensis TaxID=2590021 RepID=A0AAJ4A1P7_9BACT|nr:MULTISPECIES: hypothetical protein [Sulfurimonas]PLY10989.1 MAG: hypothetical protein C0628_09420 [Sulfurimonas sp.]QFR42401.1 hypothetical protein FJR47_00075 [Sulfurimonas xiamenensis]QHG92031.1 hypothetical protein CVO_09460 [Sulfurimonas sp. CVO]
MLKLSLIAAFVFSGCSYFEFNYAMCESIGPNADPQIIEKCRNYNEEEAQKAFDNTKTESSSDEDVLKFKKDSGE